MTEEIERRAVSAGHVAVRIAAARAERPYQFKHAYRFREMACPDCGQKQWGVGKLIGPSGQAKYPWYCRGCCHRTSIYEPKHDRLIFTRVFLDNGENQCEQCGRMGAELHHFMPQALSPDDCDLWPQAYFCQACHAKWHQVVTPNLGAH
jgi:hypothetical protein